MIRKENKLELDSTHSLDDFQVRRNVKDKVTIGTLFLYVLYNIS